MINEKHFEGVLLYLLSISLWQYTVSRIRAIRNKELYLIEERGKIRTENALEKVKQVEQYILKNEEGFFIQPIAYIQSCYRQCVGTPRQGALVPSSRASLTLTTNMSPEALDGLDEFSHLWIIFKFHLNTNTLKEAKAFKGSVKDSQKYTFKAKIVPPMLKEKKGILATRSPHRPNPIGVTLAKIVSVDKRSRRVYLCCCDLVDGTPVLDIKPYVPAYDTVLEYRVPHWIAETIETRNTVKVSDKVYEEVNMIEGELREYKNDGKSFMKGLIETLEAEVRSKFQTKRRMEDASRGLEVEVPFDNALIKYLWIDERIQYITSVELKSLNENKFLIESEISNDSEDTFDC